MTARADLKLLGSQHVEYPTDYDPSLLETFENAHQDHDYMVTFRCPEFTTLCPITGQPDFATLYINYINIIMKDLVKLMDPKYIEVRGMFYPRGGISIYPFANWANPDFDYGEIAQKRMFEQLADLDKGDGAR